MTKIAGSGSISQRHGSADLDLDPHQNVMDPQHRGTACYWAAYLMSVCVGHYGSGKLNKNVRFKSPPPPTKVFYFLFLGGGFSNYCFICRPSDSTVPTDAGIEPRTVATGALAARRCRG
jgi:hypothetical protein